LASIKAVSKKEKRIKPIKLMALKKKKMIKRNL